MSYSPNFRGEAISEVSKATYTGSDIINNTGVTLQKLTPTTLDSNGYVTTIDVGTDEALSIIGLIPEDISNGSSGSMVSVGVIKDIGTAFGLGDVLFVDKNGLLTNIEPNTGENGFVAGDYVIRVGVVSKNTDNSVLRDLHVSVAIVGQL